MATAGVAVPLPAHDRFMEEPAKSEVVLGDNGTKGFVWKVTDTERSHMAEMLNVTPSELKIRGNIMTTELMVCETCGKHSGLDDLVHNALYGGIHTASFILGVLKNGPHGESPGHELACSRCTTKHKQAAFWANAPQNWWN